MKWRALATTLGAVLLLMLLSGGRALAVDNSVIQLGANALEDGNTVYFGQHNGRPIVWRTLDADESNTGEANQVFLVSEYLLGDTQFDSSGGNAWQGSAAQTWCADFVGSTSNFTVLENGAMLPTFKTDGNDSLFGASELIGEKAFFLSARETETYFIGYSMLRATYTNGSADCWWLRSPFSAEVPYAGVIRDTGRAASVAEVVWGARPAFNLDRKSILFLSVAKGGNSFGATVADALAPSSTASISHWKVTLRDSNRNFAVSTPAVSASGRGCDVSVSYAGATVGENEYVSAMITSGSGADETVLYYGRIAKPKGPSGTAAITIPALTAGRYALKLFSEQCNGNGRSDYASEFANVPLMVGVPMIISQPPDRTVSKGDAATFRIVAGGAEPLSYQWYVNKGNGHGWVKLKANSANTARYTTSATTWDESGYLYACVVSNNESQAKSEAAELTIVDRIEPQTGDDSDLPMWTALLLLSCLGLVMVAYRKRDRSRN